jgi:membrane dipeptidase
VADNIDHICQMAGNARHVGIGSDLDGGFGGDQVPADLDTIADLRKLPEILTSRGYPEADVKAILHGNFLRFFGEALPTETPRASL